MDPWPLFVSAVLKRHGVADVGMARSFGISSDRFYRRTCAEDWVAPAPRVRVHPQATPSVKRSLLVACSTTSDLAAADQETAAWLHGLREFPPERLTVVGSHATAVSTRGRLEAHRARWLTSNDIIEIDQVPTLDLPAMFVSLCGAPADQQRARLITAIHNGTTTTGAILDRLDRIGPVAGRGVLRRQCERLAALRVESVFQDDVAVELQRLGYGPLLSTARIMTPDGRGLVVDVPLPSWQVAVEPDGDAYHRTREQRRADRRRDAAFAGTGWVRVPVDWRDWQLERGHVLSAIDAAIAIQRLRGVGASVPPPLRAPS